MLPILSGERATTVSYYYPNSANGAAWKGTGNDPPTDLADYQDVAYDGSPSEKDTVSVDDSNYVSYSFGGERAGHQVKARITQPVGDILQIDFIMKLYNGAGDAKKLFIFDDDEDPGSAVDTDSGLGIVTLTHSIMSAFADYLDGNGDLYFMGLEYQSGPILRHYYSRVAVTHYA